jgi:hypothetical protein
MLQVFFLIAIVILLPVTAMAQETTLTTVIPSSHTLHIELTGKGTVSVDGVAYAQSADAKIPRKGRPEISLQAADGYKIKVILWNDENITADFQSGKWTAPEITEDATLTVVLEKVSSNPQTGDTSHPGLWFALLILSVLAMIVCLLRKKKELA